MTRGSPIISGSGIRGIFGVTLGVAEVLRFASAFGRLSGRGRIVVGRDTRRSGPAVQAAVEAALMSVGCDPVDLGVVPTPTVQLEAMADGVCGGVAVTSSHNPGEWNALKLIGPDGVFLRRAERERFLGLLQQDWEPEGYRTVGQPQILRGAMERHVALVTTLPWVSLRGRRLKAVLDVTGGAAVEFAPMLMDSLGVDAVVINPSMTPEGDFPRVAEPTVENLDGLAAAVLEHQADIGFAFDPDGDRLALVDETGRVLGEEYTVALAIDHILTTRPGSVVVNLSTSRLADDAAARHGCRVFRSPVGEVNVVEEMERRDALTGGEGNGGVIDRGCHSGRDSGVGMACVISLLRSRPGWKLSSWADGFPKYTMVKRKYGMDLPFGQLSDEVVRLFGRPDDDRDGLWFVRPGGWLHLRPSGTEPVVRLISESSDCGSLERDLDAFNGLWEKLCVE
jgi:phosphomannomutase